MPSRSSLKMSDDEIRESVEQNQLKLQRERGTHLTIFSPRASGMGHHIGDESVSQEWSEISNDLIARVVSLYPKNFVGACQLPQSPGVDPKNSAKELERCVKMGFVGCNLKPNPSGGYFNSPPMTDKWWFPLYERMVELDCPCIIHVSGCCNPAMHTTGSYYLNADTMVFMHVILTANASPVTAARRKLAGLESLAVRSTAEDVWLLLALLRATADRFAAASIYSRVERLTVNAPRFSPRLRLFAREQFARGRGVLWTSQIHGLDRLADTSSFALCTPTGSGKTLVANLAIVKELLLTEPSDIAPLALYLVPSRALAGEVEAKLAAELGRDVIITGLYGGADWGITDYWITSAQPTVLIATVEKADALMRYLGPLLLIRLKLLIIDEAHQVVADVDARSVATLADHGSRAMRLESLVSRLLSLKPDVVRIALTAVAGGAAAPVARWMEGRSEASAVGVNYRSSRQLVGTLEASPGNPGRMQLDLMNGRPLYVRGREDPVYLPLRIPTIAASTCFCPSQPRPLQSNTYSMDSSTSPRRGAAYPYFSASRAGADHALVC